MAGRLPLATGSIACRRESRDQQSTLGGSRVDPNYLTLLNGFEGNQCGSDEWPQVSQAIGRGTKYPNRNPKALQSRMAFALLKQESELLVNTLIHKYFHRRIMVHTRAKRSSLHSSNTWMAKSWLMVGIHCEAMWFAGGRRRQMPLRQIPVGSILGCGFGFGGWRFRMNDPSRDNPRMLRAESVFL